ncbi:MAG: hypothetical protein EB084_20810, partial [Proteobacteria bacterium]|nr:hypothetical protein [Pseudomonadota bacterium]
AAEMEHRLTGPWDPTPADYQRILLGPSDAAGSAVRTDGGALDPACPTAGSGAYPFFLASALDQDVSDLGPVTDWQAEWKWDGIRCQAIHRGRQVMLWSRGEELITPGFPEIADAVAALPSGTVLDGELLAWSEPQGPLFGTRVANSLHAASAGS